MILSSLFIASTQNMGKGVFTSEKIRSKTIVEISPVIVIKSKDRTLLDQTLMHDYIFEWGETQNECCVALGYVSMYNHSYKSNCEYQMDYEKEIITIKSVRPIKAGEELLINYNGTWNENKPVWFEAK